MPELTEPPYARIAAELRRRITERELATGDKVPSTRQVAQEFGVALATASKALDALRAEGLVITRPRSGSVVAPRRAPRTTPGGTAKSLDRNRMVREAIALADAEGINGLSMRAVAQRCGVTPMALYRFVDSKHALLIAMADATYGTTRIEDNEADLWRSRIEALARALWQVHRTHPWLGQIQPLTRPLPVPNLLAVSDRLLCALNELGLPPKLCFDANVLLYSHIATLAANFEREEQAISETGLSAQEWTDLRYPPRRGKRDLTVGLPNFTTFFDHFTELPEGYDLNLDELFELSLGLLLDGIETLSRRHGTG